MSMREKKTGSLYQRHEKRLGCPPASVGPDGRKLRDKNGRYVHPPHKCKGAWVAAVELPGTDTQRRRKVVVRAKKADASRELTRLRALYAAKGDMSTRSVTVSQWLDAWWKEFGLNRLKVSARPSYKSRIKEYIRPCLGRYRLDRLGPEHVDRLREYITVEKGLSSTSALGAHRVLSVILRDAERRGLIEKNPCALTDAPRKTVRKVKEGETYLTSAQARDLLASVDSGDGTVSLDLARWSIALLTGMRQGERLGLTREMVDLERGIITVAWQLQRVPYDHGCGNQSDAGTWPCGRRKGGYCPKKTVSIPEDQESIHVSGGMWLLRPKSKAGWREVPMFGPLHWVLKTYMETHEPGMGGLLLARADGRYIDPSQDTDDWDASLKAARLPDVTGHSARKTTNTILTELGVPVDVRKKILGHASEAVNEAFYTATSDLRVGQAMKALGEAIDWR